MIRSKCWPLHQRLGSAALVLGACCFSTQVKAESVPSYEGGPPFYCRPGEVRLRNAVLPRNVFGIPFDTGSPTYLSVPGFELVGTAATLATQVVEEPDQGSMVLIRPASPPPQGAYSLRYQERCQRLEGGDGWEDREETVNYPITFGPEAPLPTTAGTLRVEQLMSNQPPVEVTVRKDGGACEVVSSRFLVLAFFWTPSADLAPFQDVTEVHVDLPSGINGFWKSYGEPNSASLLILCNDAGSQYGFVDGKGLVTLHARLAGATQELIPSQLMLQLECPTPTFVSKCNEPDASDEGHDPPDANRGDGGSDARDDVTPRPDASDAKSESLVNMGWGWGEPGDERPDDVPRWQYDAAHEANDDSGEPIRRDSGTDARINGRSDATTSADAGTVGQASTDSAAEGAGCSCRTVPNRTIPARTAWLAGLGLLVFGHRAARTKRRKMLS